MSPTARHRTAAWPLAAVYAVLVVYASLYPFEGWRLQGIAPWSFLWAPWPRYWSRFDLVANVLGYAPLGFFIALAWLRDPRRRRWAAVLLALALCSALSLCMESLQMWLPRRVPSNADALLNALGALLGALVARGLDAMGVLARWGRFRQQWFGHQHAGALTLLALWPLALLFPAAVPFGLGQVLERLENTLAQWLEGTPWLEWLPLRDVELQPMLPMAELICMVLGLLLPLLLAYSLVRGVRQRLLLAAALGLAGVLASALSAALTWGPAHAWAWLDAPTLRALLLAALLALALLRLSPRAAVLIALIGLVWQLSMLNNASASVYFVQNLQIWEQGRFIRFHGLIQWMGWLWPYGLLWHLVLRLMASPARAQG